VVSENTGRDVIERFSVPESKVHVVYPIVSSIFTNAATETDGEVLRRYDLLQSYILFVGTIEPRKNLGRLLEAYTRLAPSVRKQVRLVLVGRQGWKSEDVVRSIRMLEAKSEVRWLQTIPDDELAVLYRHALVVTYPSLYEGFGYPVAEALACGAPVITSNVASLPEITGQAAVLIEPSDTNALAEALTRVIHDDTQREKLRRLGPQQVRRFGREQSAARVLSLYKSLA
jgi:glycosyltransferase involved in cell wall biosynthesis